MFTKTMIKTSLMMSKHSQFKMANTSYKMMSVKPRLANYNKQKTPEQKKLEEEL
jgi:hypothetical protein